MAFSPVIYLLNTTTKPIYPQVKNIILSNNLRRKICKSPFSIHIQQLDQSIPLILSVFLNEKHEIYFKTIKHTYLRLSLSVQPSRRIRVTGATFIRVQARVRSPAQPARGVAERPLRPWGMWQSERKMRKTGVRIECRTGGFKGAREGSLYETVKLCRFSVCHNCFKQGQSPCTAEAIHPTAVIFLFGNAITRQLIERYGIIQHRNDRG